MNFAETRLAEVRWMNFAELASRKFAEADDPKTSSHRLLKIGNLSAGVAARMRPRSRSGPCPLRPHPYWWQRGRTSSTQRTSPAQCEHAMIPAENPPNVRQRGRYNRQFVRPNERSGLDYSRGARPRMAGCGC